METKTCELMITNSTVLLPDLTLQPNMAIAIQGDKIAAIGRAFELEQAYRSHRRLDGEGKVAMPGLVDAHTHTCQQLLRGRVMDEPPMIWARILVPYESNLEPEDVYWSA
ncbi:MAG: amidohydrolase, partial [Chloroflexi bacterium]|nr:amidohydrolase [Chloroflexota bacterium]